MPINNPRRRINIRDLEAFVEVAQALSFSRAAETLHISQPTLSDKIRNLEHTIGARLLDRSTRSVELTSVGKELLKLGRQLLFEFDLTFEKLDSIVTGNAGSLRIAASPSVMASFLPGALRRFSARLPGVEVQLVEKVYEDCIDALRCRQVEVALTPRKQTAADLMQRELFVDKLVLICPEGHPLTHFQSVRWEQIAQFPQVAMRPTSNVRQLIDHEYLRVGLSVTPIYEVDRVNSMIGFIGAGLGIGILPHSFLRVHNQESISLVPIDDLVLSRVICASYLRDAALSSPAQMFIENCIEHLVNTD